MSGTAEGVRRTERYVYNSLHWAFPMLPVTGLLLATGAPVQWSLPWMLLLALAGWAGLVVLHTRLRDADLLPPSRWDAFRVRNLGPVRWLWIVAGLVSAVSAGFVVPPEGFFVAGLAGAMVGGVLAMPMLGRPTTRPIAIGLTGIALGQLTVWVGPDPGPDAALQRVIGAYWSALAAAALVGYAVMFRNVLCSTRELERARADTARLAVAEERLRFSRDLHDVFGRTLAAVALEAELAAEQASRGRPEAVATMREVQSIAIGALAEVREVVRGYRKTDLITELAGARSLLEASGVTVSTLTDGTAGLPAPVTRAFAWVVREGTTNVLRHSDATRVSIALAATPDRARLTLRNDRPRPASEASGSGLTGLAERMTEIGGTLAVDRNRDAFTLTADVDAAALARLRAAAGDDDAGESPPGPRAAGERAAGTVPLVQGTVPLAQGTVPLPVRGTAPLPVQETGSPPVRPSSADAG